MPSAVVFFTKLPSACPDTSCRIFPCPAATRPVMRRWRRCNESKTYSHSKHPLLLWGFLDSHCLPSRTRSVPAVLAHDYRQKGFATQPETTICHRRMAKFGTLQGIEVRPPLRNAATLSAAN